jgi:hypothetical protein
VPIGLSPLAAWLSAQRTASTPAPLDLDAMDWGNLADDWWRFLDTTALAFRPPLQVNPAAVPIPADARWVSVQGKTDLRYGANLTVTATFFLVTRDKGAVEVASLVRAIGFTEAWTLGGTFQALPLPDVLGRIPWHGLELLYSSVDLATDAAAIAAARGLGDLALFNGAPPKAGINLKGQIEASKEIAGPLGLLGGWAAGARQTVSATITRGEKALVLDVDLPVSGGHVLPLGGVKAGVDLHCGIDKLRLSSGLFEWSVPPPMLAAQFSLGTGGDAVRFTLMAPIGMAPGDSVWLMCDAQVSLSAIEKAIGLDSLSARLPADIPLPNLVIESFSAEATIQPMKLTRITVAASSAAPWRLYPAFDKATLQPTVTFDIPLGPGAPPPDISISANWQIGGTRFLTFISPQTGEVSASMAVGEHLDIGDLIKPVLPDFIHADIELHDIEIAGNFRDKTWSLEVETSKGFALDLGGPTLKVEDVEVQIEDLGFGWMTRLVGYVGIGEFMLRADMQVTPTTLDLQVSSPPINLSEIAEPFLRALYKPEHLGDFVLDGIAVDISRTSASGQGAGSSACAFRVDSTSRTPVDFGGGVSFQLSSFRAARDAGGIKSGSLALDVKIDSHPIALAGDYGKDAASGKYVWHLKSTGGVATPIPIGAALDALGRQLGIEVPGPIRDFALNDLELTYVPDNGELHLAVATETTVVSQPIKLRITIDLTAPDASVAGGKAKRTAHFGGTLAIGTLQFAVSYGAGLLLGTLSKDTSITLVDLAGALGFHPAIPDGIDVGLKGLELVYRTIKDDKTGVATSVLMIAAQSQSYGRAVLVVRKVGAVSTCLFATQIAISGNLSDVPLIGAALPAGAGLSLQGLNILIASKPLAAEDVAAINALFAELGQHLPPGAAWTLPGQALGSGPALSVALTLGSEPRLVTLDMMSRARAAAPAQTPVVPAAPSAPSLPAKAPAVSVTPPAGQPDAGGALKWIKVDKTLGPFSVRRVGLGFDHAQLAVATDASVALGALTLSLLGLEIRTPLTRFAPGIELSGIDIDFDASDVEISGGLSKTIGPNGAISYDGEALIKTPAMSISALGAFSSIDGDPSLFVFAVENKPLGGPAFCYITALAAGFGYNRKLKRPNLDEIHQFPLLAGLADSSVFGGGTLPSPAQALSALESWIEPRHGEYWFALGMQFTTFSIITTNALLIVEFGGDPAISILGISVLRQPIQGDAYVYGELDFEAVFKPRQGELMVSAVLAPGSYVLTPDAHLTGGFAFYSWFSGEHGGDFVYTCGGYHPAFVVPSHYPQEPRLGINWQVGGGLSIVGESYFAITPAAMMAGVSLQVSFHDGPLSAWLKAQADAIVFWNPFYFIAEVSISVGISYHLDLLFVETTLSVEIGADFLIWGPPVGGEAYIDWSIISFTIGFGADRRQADTIGWDDFKRMLPVKQERAGPAQNAATAKPAYLNVVTVKGLKRTHAVGDLTFWLVRAAQVQFAIASAVPASAIAVETLQQGFAGRPVGMRHVNGGVGFKDYRSTLSVAVLRLSSTGIDHIHGCMATTTLKTTAGDKPILLHEWEIAPTEAPMPRAMWGDLAEVDAPGMAPTLPATIGLTLRPKAPPLNNRTPDLSIDQIFADRTVNPTDQWRLAIAPDRPATGAAPQRVNSAFADLASLADPAVAKRRSAILGALTAMGLGAFRDAVPAKTAADPGHALADAPLEGSAASAAARRAP